MVIIKKDSTPRAFWRLARIQELLPGADGCVRAAQLRVSSENGKMHITRRVIQQLVPIEVRSSLPAKDTNAQLTSVEITNESTTSERIQRRINDQGEQLRW